MFKTLNQPAAAAFSFLLLLCASFPLHAQVTALPPTAPDANLFISYFFGFNFQDVAWVVCGSTQQTSGCFDSGNLGPFGKVGAMIEGDPAVSGNTVTRGIFVVDCNGSGNGVELYGYKRVDTITSTFDTTTVTLIKQIALPLTGGSTAACSMVANKQLLFIASDQAGGGVVEVKKSNLNVTPLSGFPAPITLTVNQYGFVTVTSGSFGNNNGSFEQFNPAGQGVQVGGGSWFMLGTQTGVSIANLPPAATQMPPNFSDRLKISPLKQP
jgi:hypothetical protein